MLVVVVDLIDDLTKTHSFSFAKVKLILIDASATTAAAAFVDVVLIISNHYISSSEAEKKHTQFVSLLLSKNFQCNFLRKHSYKENNFL